MNISDFQAGIFSNQFGYRSFFPEFINRNWEVSDPELLILLEAANYKLGELSGLSTILPDIQVFTQTYIAKEGTQSSRIEGTRTLIDETLQAEKEIEIRTKAEARTTNLLQKVFSAPAGKL